MDHLSQYAMLKLYQYADLVNSTISHTTTEYSLPLTLSYATQHLPNLSIMVA
jgi:hypothetical protein